jgi:hypothetical protein
MLFAPGVGRFWTAVGFLASIVQQTWKWHRERVSNSRHHEQTWIALSSFDATHVGEVDPFCLRTRSMFCPKTRRQSPAAIPCVTDKNTLALLL